jgi:hypothetical protein
MLKKTLRQKGAKNKTIFFQKFSGKNHEKLTAEKHGWQHIFLKQSIPK